MKKRRTKADLALASLHACLPTLDRRQAEMQIAVNHIYLELHRSEINVADIEELVCQISNDLDTVHYLVGQMQKATLEKA